MPRIANAALKQRLFTIMIACLIIPLVTTTVSTAAPAMRAQPPVVSTKPIYLTDPVLNPSQEGVTYFIETGHTLRGKFLDYWQQNGGLAQFGYPLTEEFFEPDGPNDAFVQVQYFERARFELHPENQPPNDVLLGTLGLEFHAQEPSVAQEAAPAGYFLQTGHNLLGKFLDYWHDHGGLAVNGYPISEAQMETGADGKQYLTQWFERSRFELHPENAGTPYEVLVGQLGRELSEKRGYPYGWYPHFGYAVDYSWVAGYLDTGVYYAGPGFWPTLGCSLFQYGYEGESREIQLNYPSARQYIFHQAEVNKDLRVVFGRLAEKDEPKRNCYSTDELVLFVTSKQTNPAQR